MHRISRGQEPDNMPSAEPETATKAKARAEPWPEMSAPPNPEPLPDWDVALKDWKSLWELHYIGFGALFFGVAVFSCICVVKIKHRAKGMTLGNYFLAVCVMLMTFCVSRTLYLFLDPYESHTILDLPVLLSRILFAIGYPCLTSALSLIHFAFLEVNKLRLISRRLQNIKFLVSVIATHFVVVLIVYLVITLAPKLARLLILCQTVLISWWLILAVCFLYSGWKVNWESQITAKFFNNTMAKERIASTLSTSSLNPSSNITVEQAKTFNNDQNKPSKGAQKNRSNFWPRFDSRAAKRRCRTLFAFLVIQTLRFRGRRECCRSLAMVGLPNSKPHARFFAMFGNCLCYFPFDSN